VIIAQMYVGSALNVQYVNRRRTDLIDLLPELRTIARYSENVLRGSLAIYTIVTVSVEKLQSPLRYGP
jgi:hypothetical protein